jgi:hypothetical protein
MVYTLAYQIYKDEHGVTAAAQRAADQRAGETAAALRDLSLRLRRALRSGPRPAHGSATDAAAAPVQVVPGVR